MGVANLRVAVDATPLLGQRTGVGVYTAALLDGLAARHDLDVVAHAFTRANGRQLQDEVPDGVTARVVRVPAGLAHRWWMRAWSPSLDRWLGRPDVVHGTNFVVPPTRSPAIVTVHDLTTLHHPELCHPDTLRYPALIQQAVAHGAWVHTVSEAVRAEVIAHFAVDSARVVAVPNGFDRVHGDAATGRRIAGVDAYVLAVGTIEPRKDLPTLVRALAASADTEPSMTVVHAGPGGWGVAALDEALAATGMQGRFVRLGSQSRQQLRHLYAGARLFAYPSIYEGFGLPVLEAMSADVPVVTTDAPALVEVGGDAVASVPVGDHDALAAAMVRAWSDESWRDAAIERGRQRCRQFSWDATVHGLVDLYRLVAVDT